MYGNIGIFIALTVVRVVSGATSVLLDSRFVHVSVLKNIDERVQVRL